MRPRMILAALAIVAAFAGLMLPTRTPAEVYDQCPVGYYYDPNYGCLPLSYFYGPPAYGYPDLGFGFFYGGNWNRGAPYGYPGRWGRAGGHAYSGGVHAGGGGHPGGGGRR
jgi:hypothetical protein